MIVIRCTERLLKGSRITPEAQPPAPDALLGEWYATAVALPFAGRWLTVYVHAGSLLTITVAGRTIGGTLGGFRERVVALLRRQGLPDEWIEARRAELADAVIARTASRRMLSYINQIVQEILADADVAGSFDGMDLEGLEDSFAGRPFSAGKHYFFPENLLREAVAGAPMPDLTVSRGR